MKIHVKMRDASNHSIKQGTLDVPSLDYPSIQAHVHKRGFELLEVFHDGKVMWCKQLQTATNAHGPASPHDHTFPKSGIRASKSRFRLAILIAIGLIIVIPLISVGYVSLKKAQTAADAEQYTKYDISDNNAYTLSVSSYYQPEPDASLGFHLDRLTVSFKGHRDTKGDMTDANALVMLSMKMTLISESPIDTSSASVYLDSPVLVVQTTPTPLQLLDDPFFSREGKRVTRFFAAIPFEDTPSLQAFLVDGGGILTSVINGTSYTHSLSKTLTKKLWDTLITGIEKGAVDFYQQTPVK